MWVRRNCGSGGLTLDSADTRVICRHVPFLSRQELLLFSVVAYLLVSRFSIGEALPEGEKILLRRTVSSLLAEKCVLQQRVVVRVDRLIYVALSELLLVEELLRRCGRLTPLT